jgi:hypothetical protein
MDLISLPETNLRRNRLTKVISPVSESVILCGKERIQYQYHPTMANQNIPKTREGPFPSAEIKMPETKTNPATVKIPNIPQIISFSVKGKYKL